MVKIYQGDCISVLKTLPAESVNCCVTSPPYWGLRDYGVEGQLGLEKTPEEYVSKMVDVFREVRRVLRGDGTLWLNLGDSYYNYRPGAGQALSKQTVSKTTQDLPKTCHRRGQVLYGLKEKDIIGIPWMVAFALRSDGWYLRQDIIWSKPNPMPESVTDRCTKAHEYIFLMSKSQRYYFDQEAIKEPVTGGAHRRCSSYKTPDGWDTGKGSHGSFHKDGREKGHIGYEYKHPGVTPKSAKPGSGIKANESFHAACVGLVDSRNPRSVWTVPTAPFTGWSQTVHWERVALGDVSGGMKRIASPDCPIHGRRDFQCDEHGACFLNHKSCIDSCHAQWQEGAAIYSLSNHDEQTQGCNSDCHYQGNDSSAISHNNGIHKTGRVQQTSFSCSVCGKTLSRIDGIQEELLIAGLADRIFWNNTAPAVMDDHPLVQTLFRSVHKSSLPIPPDCLCSYYRRKVSKSSHFATFPPKLIEPCILAGCPMGGTVLDPFGGSGTVGFVAEQNGRNSILIELNSKYVEMARRRTAHKSIFAECQH